MSMKYAVGIAAAIATVVALAFIWFWIGEPSSEAEVSEEPERTEASQRLSLKDPREAPAGYVEYRSEFYRFQFFHPDSLTIAEYPVPVSAMTLVFASPETGETFQIFIVPHGSANITDHRLKQDLPSGVMEEVEDIEIDGAEGIAFISHDPAIGQTREVWFVARGFLYEVTAPLSLDNWLSEILRSWEFL